MGGGVCGGRGGEGVSVGVGEGVFGGRGCAGRVCVGGGVCVCVGGGGVHPI